MTKNKQKTGPVIEGQTFRNDKADETDFPAFTFEAERYEHYLAGCDLTEEQKQEFLATLWNIVVSFVDLGFGLDSTQAVCGKLLQSAFDNTIPPSDSVKSNHTSSDTYKKTAAPAQGAAKEGVEA